MSSSTSFRTLALGALGLLLSGQALAQNFSLPELSSRPGAAYTLYLNFGGFNYTGTWDGKTPGNVPAFTVDNDTATFSSGDVNALKDAWARVAQKYTPFNVNVTTVDPAIAAGRATSDLSRQQYYAETARVMHTIIGGSNSWYSSGAGGVSYVGVTENAYSSNSPFHTNWVFPDSLGRSAKNVGEAAAHEQGHGLSLSHQSDESNGAQYSTNGGASGFGSYAPTMGVAYSSQRGTWRQDNAGTFKQNDVAVLLSNNGMGGLIDSGIGHSLATATPMPVIGNAVDFNLAEGIIVPANGAAAGALGVENYISDYFSFFSEGGLVSLTVNEGSQFLQPGVADPGTTLDSTLTILDQFGNAVGSGLADVTTLKKTFSGTLAAGKYYAQIGSRGGYLSSREPNSPYFTMGSYFLTGSGVTPVPEPATLAAMGLGLLALARRRRKSS